MVVLVAGFDAASLARPTSASVVEQRSNVICSETTAKNQHFPGNVDCLWDWWSAVERVAELSTDLALYPTRVPMIGTFLGRYRAMVRPKRRFRPKNGSQIGGFSVVSRPEPYLLASWSAIPAEI